MNLGRRMALSTFGLLYTKYTFENVIKIWETFDLAVRAEREKAFIIRENK